MAILKELKMGIAESIKKLREDKTVSEQMRLIAQLNDKDKSTVMNIVDTMLTKQKFQTFFEQNLQISK